MIWIQSQHHWSLTVSNSLTLDSYYKYCKLLPTRGQFSILFQHCTFRILAKKLVLTETFKNYQPVSNLGYIPKLIEKAVARQINEHIAHKGISNENQSSYRVFHPTEMMLLKIQNDIATSMDKGAVVGLVLLDLSAAFDTIDHSILFNCHYHWYGIDGVVLKWVQSYLSSRKQRIKIEGHLSGLSPGATPFYPIYNPSQFSHI